MARPLTVAAVAVPLAAAIVQVLLARAAVESQLPVGVWMFLLAFLAGPLLFLALLAWRRRDHSARCGLLLGISLLVAVCGIAIHGYDYFFSGPSDQRRRSANPVMLPAMQWAAVLAVWVGLVIRESRDKRAYENPA